MQENVAGLRIAVAHDVKQKKKERQGPESRAAPGSSDRVKQGDRQGGDPHGRPLRLRRYCKGRLGTTQRLVKE